LDDVRHGGDVQVRVRVNHLDALAADGDLAALRRRAPGRLRQHVIGEPAADADAGGRRGDRFHEVSAILHVLPRTQRLTTNYQLPTTNYHHRYAVVDGASFNSLIKFPPRIASFWPSLRNFALRMKSGVTGQPNGMSVP